MLNLLQNNIPEEEKKVERKVAELETEIKNVKLQIK